MDDIDAELAALRPDYLAARRRDLIMLRQLLAQQDWNEIRRIGHRMKGTGATYGFAEVSRLGDAIEIAAQSFDAGAMHTLLDRLDAVLTN